MQKLIRKIIRLFNENAADCYKIGFNDACYWGDSGEYVNSVIIVDILNIKSPHYDDGWDVALGNDKGNVCVS